jgi:hypothetical protein
MGLISDQHLSFEELAIKRLTAAGIAADLRDITARKRAAQARTGGYGSNGGYGASKQTEEKESSSFMERQREAKQQAMRMQLDDGFREKIETMIKTTQAQTGEIAELRTEVCSLKQQVEDLRTMSNQVRDGQARTARQGSEMKQHHL